MRTAAPIPEAPRLPQELDRCEVAELRHGDHIAELELGDLLLVDQRANGVRLEAITASNVDLSGSRLEHASIADSALRRCNLANMQARNAGLLRVVVEESRMTGLAVPEGTLRDVTIRDCRINLKSRARDVRELRAGADRLPRGATRRRALPPLRPRAR
jgi:uncharacterized protein YjbI with pentapeptide repeats